MTLTPLGQRITPGGGEAVASSGVVDRFAMSEALVSFIAPRSLEADQYRKLRHVVERLRNDSNAQVFAVTSPTPGDGKTVTVLNIAGSLAQSPDARVLVIDADLHRPAVAEYLGLAYPRPRMAGLADAVLKGYSLAQAAHRLDSLNISVLLPGNCHDGPYEVLASPRIEGLLAEAREMYDYVLIDTPPVVPLVDCGLLGRWIDGFMVVVAAHKTPRTFLAEALRLLDSSKVLGVVFNGDDRPLTPYYGYYSYQRPPAKPFTAMR